MKQNVSTAVTRTHQPFAKAGFRLDTEFIDEGRVAKRRALPDARAACEAEAGVIVIAAVMLSMDGLNPPPQRLHFCRSRFAWNVGRAGRGDGPLEILLIDKYPTFHLLTDFAFIVRLYAVSTTSKTDSVRFTTKGQVVIPSWLRKQFNIEDGTKAVVQATPEGILLKPVTRWAIERGFGLLKRKPGGKSFNEEWTEHKRTERELEDKS